MTNKEAIAIFKRMQEPEAWEPQITSATFEALDMAIEALSSGKDTDVPSNDTISRQAAIDVIDSLFEHEVDSELDSVWNQAVEMASNKIKYNLPSAQPEIIRCKECEHWDTSWQNDFAPNHHYCPLVDGTRRGDFYCADGEIRGEQDE